MLAARREASRRRPSRYRLWPASRSTEASARDLDLFGGEAPQLRIVVTVGLELRQGQRAIVQDDRGGVMRRQQRLEFGFVGAKAAMHVEGALAERDADLAHARDVDLVLAR